MLYMITNRHLLKSGDLFKTIEAAAFGGIDFLILREKDLKDSELSEIATKVKDITQRHNIRF